MFKHSSFVHSVSHSAESGGNGCLTFLYSPLSATMKSENDCNDVTEYNIQYNPMFTIQEQVSNSGQEPELDFILTFEKHPELWDPSNLFYTNKYVRFRNINTLFFKETSILFGKLESTDAVQTVTKQKALTELLPILKKIKPFATIDDVRKKINCIRSNHRRELRKVRNSIKSGEEYNPRVWRYRYLSFLREIDKEKVDNENTSNLEEMESLETSEDGTLDLLKPKLHIATHQTSSPIKVEKIVDPLNEEHNIPCDPEFTKQKELDMRQESELDFILTFEKLPELWDPSNEHYTNKIFRKKALTKLLPILKKLKPFATLVDVRKKINSIRSNHRRELRKVRTLTRTGEDYKPRAWNYPYLNFLREVDKEKLYNEDSSHLMEMKTPYSDETSDDGTSISNMPKLAAALLQKSSPGNEFSHLEKMKSLYDEKSEDGTFTSNIPKLVSAVHQTLSPQRIKVENVEDPLDEGQYTFEPCTPNIYPPIVQEWASTLERLDPVQRIYAKKAINDVLFEAELGNLRKDSIKIN